MAPFLRAASTCLGMLALVSTACAPDWSPGELSLTEGRPNEEESGESGDPFEYGICGNGLHEPGEFCDDGDEIWGDGCNPDCHRGGDVLWRDSILTPGKSFRVEGLERFPDGSIAVIARAAGYPYERLSLGWRADGAPAWTRVPENFESQSGDRRISLMHEGHLFIADRWGTTNSEGVLEWGLHFEELDSDGELVSSLDLPLTRSNQLSHPIVHLEAAPAGLRLVAELDGKLDVHRLDFVSGQWSLEPEPFALALGYWQEVVSHARLPDDTQLYFVRSEASSVHWLYRVGGDRAVAEWDVLVVSGVASMRVRNDALYLFVQPDWWDAPYVWQYDLEANFVGSWPMSLFTNQSSFYFEAAIAEWFGSEEIVIVGTEYGDLGRQTLSGEDRWGRVYEHPGYRPQRLHVGEVVSDAIIVAGQTYDAAGEFSIFVEARSP